MDSNAAKVKPFLKWAGGKLRIVAHIKEVLPPGRRLIEPFVGSGAVFLNTDYDHYLLADANPDLIGLYRQLQQEGEAFIRYCQRFFTPETNQRPVYYEYRDRFNRSQDPRERAALFLYLNRHGYNGLCRYNASGQFNVPFGRYKRPYFPEAEMEAFLEKARRARLEFQVADFVETLSAAQVGDVVYCDPPYVPLSATANFTGYSKEGFGPAEQLRLAELAQALAARGVPVVISNHDTDFTAQAYARAREKRRLTVRRHISCDGANRNEVREILAVFH